MEVAKNQPKLSPKRDRFATSIPQQHVQMLLTTTLKPQRDTHGRHVIPIKVTLYYIEISIHSLSFQNRMYTHNAHIV